MSSLNFNYKHPLFEKTIQLYGDRVGGQGNYEFAGLAELNNTKVILLHGNTNSLEQPADWRRFQRLINLAQRLKKPVVLWNIHLENAATTQHQTSLALATAIQNTKIQLVKMQLPIIAVYDDAYGWDTESGKIGWVDGCIIVKQDKVGIQNHTNSKERTLKGVCKENEISEQIKKLLNELSKKPSEKLVTDRLQSLGVN
ncbi:hypothetical protein F4X73_13415 [Candidatus Poribacteria bacterium]|nr:hypothetical protein [Candidatus Poribacteria bacterium]MYB65683.1 hypothetical protein [Candidatus Poribacteria bacterium]